MSQTKNYKRRNYMINPKFQLRFMGYIAFALMVSLTVLYLSNSFYFDKLVEQGDLLGLDPTHIYYEFIDEQRDLLTKTYLGLSGAVFIVLMAFGLFLSHRIAGPLYHIRNILEAIANDQTDNARVHLRDGDFFPEMEEAINHVITQFQDEADKQNRQSLAYIKDVAAVKAVAGSRVLIVEDNEINRELVVELLTSNGVSVDVAENGQVALDILAIDPEFDGVLMDGQMPVMDGYVATRKLRELAQFADLPVIAMTANVMASDQQIALDSGMNDHIGKPINVSELFAVMAKWIKPTSPIYRSDGLQQDKGGADIPEIEEVDVEQGLARTQGNLELYLRLLNRFVQSQSDFSERFTIALADEDPRAAEREAHTLKGVAGNIGITSVQQLSEQLEKACVEQPGKHIIVEIEAQVTQKLEVVLHNISRVLYEIESEGRSGTVDNADENQQELSSDEFSRKFKELRGLIRNNETSANDAAALLLANAHPDERDQLRRITEALGRYNFDEAGRLIEGLDRLSDQQ